MTAFHLFLGSTLIASVAIADANVDKPEKYSVQPGDSLSSISKTFFGDANYWPKIWNKGAKGKSKSKLVGPGHSIRLFLGNEDDAPAFSIAEVDDSEEVSAPALRPARVNGGMVDIPPTKYPPKPVLSKIPLSFPEYQSVHRKDYDVSDYGVQVLQRRPVNPNDVQILPVYVQDEALEYEGEYLRASENFIVAMNNDQVFVRMKKGVGQSGARYLLVRDGGALKPSPFLNIRSGNHQSGHVIEVMGEVELGGLAESKDDSSWDYRRATMIHTLGLSLKDVKLVPGQVTRVGLGTDGVPSGVSAEVIGGNFDSKGMFFGAGSWVFINKGGADGVQPGQMLWVNTNLEAHGDDTPIYVGNTRAALVKIVKTSNSVATGIVLSSKDAITQGDGTGQISSAILPGGEESELLDESGSGLDLGDELEDLGGEDLGP